MQCTNFIKMSFLAEYWTITDSFSQVNNLIKFMVLKI